MADYDESGNPVGRPKIPLDWEQIEALCKIQCTGEEIAAVFSCSYDTLARRCKDELGVNFADYIAEKRLGGRASLRRYQWQLAQKGNATMQIWLGKNILGQKDQPPPDDSTDEAAPLTLHFTVKEPVDDIKITNAQPK